MNHAIGCKIFFCFFFLNPSYWSRTCRDGVVVNRAIRCKVIPSPRQSVLPLGPTRDCWFVAVERKAHPSHLFYKRPRGVEPVLSPPSKIPSQLLCCHWCLASMSSSSLIVEPNHIPFIKFFLWPACQRWLTPSFTVPFCKLLKISKSISLFFGSPSSCCGRICVYCLAITCPTEFQESWW